MTRRITYANQLANSLYALQDQKEAMIELAALTHTVLGTTTYFDGFPCAPTSPPSLAVQVGGGTMYSYQVVDATDFGEPPSVINADTTDHITKLAWTFDTDNISITPPATVGFSRNDLIQIAFVEADGSSALVPFWNGTGASGFPNPPITATKNTQRVDSAVISVVTGVAAATGTQVTPSPTGASVGAWIVTTAHGDTTITSGAITVYNASSFLTERLPDKISQATADSRYAKPVNVQSGQYLLCVPTGTDTYVGTMTPTLTAYVSGQVINAVFTNPNTVTNPTLNIDGRGAVTIVNYDTSPLVPGQLADMVPIYYNQVANKFHIVNAGNVTGASSITANGYQILPSGLMIQWGNFTVNASGGTQATQSFTFAHTFPNNLFSITANPNTVSNGSAGCATFGITAQSSTGFTVELDQLTSNITNNILFHFIATGN
jgi:hypothetical protein